MKKQLFILTIISLIIMSCSNKKETISDPYLGAWSRSFDLLDSKAEVIYTFYNDKVQYEMQGGMSLKYIIKKDTFLINENKWIGNKDGETYVIFLKDKTDKEFTLLKLKTKDLTSALKMPFPADTAKSNFSSWNTFIKK